VKGWFSGAAMIVSGTRYQLNFYDPVRLRQTIEEELENGSLFFEPNLVIVKSVTGSEMEQAVRQLAESDQVKFLVPD
jgi:hypothetical protein